MDAAGLVRVDEQLDSFVGEVFSPLERKDRRATARLYLRGQMLDGRRKSMQPMVQHLRVDHQRLQRRRQPGSVGLLRLPSSQRMPSWNKTAEPTNWRSGPRFALGDQIPRGRPVRPTEHHRHNEIRCSDIG